MKKTTGQWLKQLGACNSAVDWVGREPIADAWAACARPEWLLWLAVKTGCPQSLARSLVLEALPAHPLGHDSAVIEAMAHHDMKRFSTLPPNATYPYWVVEVLVRGFFLTANTALRIGQYEGMTFSCDRIRQFWSREDMLAGWCDALELVRWDKEEAYGALVLQ